MGGIAWNGDIDDCALAPDCECDENADCQDNVFCNGTEICIANQCQPGTPPICPGSSECVEAFCHPTLDVCATSGRPFGTTCGNSIDSDCDHADSCDGGGNCIANIEPMGAPCGNPAEAECDQSDTCNGSGECLSNFAADGTSCTDDGNPCTLDACLGGSCIHIDANLCGACCDTSTGVCEDDVLGSNCPTPMQFTLGQTCANVTCQVSIPTISNWGLVVLALLLGVIAKVEFDRRRTTVDDRNS